MDYLKAKGAPGIADEVLPEDDFLWRAFHYLRGSRGFSGAIPLSEITNYADHCGVTSPIQREILTRAVVQLDNLEREHGRSEA